MTLVGTERKNQQGQILVQNLNRIVSKPNVRPGQILYCTADCIRIDIMFQETFLLAHKFGTTRVIEMTAYREEWSELHMGDTTNNPI